MGGNGSHSSGSGTGQDFPPVFSWDWDGKRLIFVGVGRERFENSLPCHPLVLAHCDFLGPEEIFLVLETRPASPGS